MAVAQVHTAIIDSVDGTPANNDFTVTIGGIAITVAGDTDVATTATALRAALNASEHPYFSTITWSGTAGNIIGTADTKGCPFVAALTETGVGSGAVTDFAETTANRGPSEFRNAENWSDQTLPASSDTIIFADNGIHCAWGLDQSAITGMICYADHSYSGRIGLDRRSFATSADGVTTNPAAPEYRDHTLAFDWTNLEIGRDLTGQNFTGSPLLKFSNTRTNSSATIIHQTAAGSADAPPVVMLKTAHSGATIEIRKGSVGYATDVPGETATAGTIEVSGTDAATVLSIGNGVTVTTVNISEGTNIVRAAANITTMKIDGGITAINGSGYDVVGLTVNAGTVFLDGGVDITTTTINGGEVDGSRSNVARTITTLNLNDGLFVTDSTITVTTLNGPSTGSLSAAA